jgi:hypothetical protein
MRPSYAERSVVTMRCSFIRQSSLLRKPASTVQLARDFPGRDVGVVRDLPQAPDFPTI